VTRRWFLTHVTLGAGTAAADVRDGRPRLRPSVTVTRQLGDAVESFPVAGPELRLLGPGDVVGFDRAQVVREEPTANVPDASPSDLACVEFADASLPWLFSRPARDRPLPWIALVVLRVEEAKLVGGRPLPVLTAPGAALPNLAESWAWAHVEARVADGASPEEAVRADVRSGSQAVVSRLVCPRRLAPDSAWLACVVPTTQAGVAAGLGGAPGAVARPYGPAWTAGQAGSVRLPVYHSWRFGTGRAGSSFEELATAIEPLSAPELAARTGFGERAVSVRDPWPGTRLFEGAPADATVTVQGALRVPGTARAVEPWSDEPSRARFVETLTRVLDAPAARFRAPDEPAGEPADGIAAVEPPDDASAVAPPIYGGQFAGVTTVLGDGWPAQLNLEVRHRIAAALGTRYVQQEQEFLMARAWEQLGAVNEANRLLAVRELASEAATQAQVKHVATLDAGELTLLADPMRTAVTVSEQGTLARTLADSALPDGLASTAFKRIARAGGGLDRRIARVRAAAPDAMPAPAPLLAEGLAGRRLLPEPIASVTAEPAGTGATVGADRASLPAAQALVGLLDGQRLLLDRDAPALAQLDSLQAVATTMAGAVAATAVSPSPRALRGLRRQAEAVAIEPPLEPPPAPSFELGLIAAALRRGIEPLGQQLQTVGELIAAADVTQRTAEDPRPLRPIMEHPRFGMPMAVELLQRWPDWALPGLSGFPANRATLLEANVPFVEALLVGLNHEFNRELLWREFPTDQLGTAFARFWPAPGGAPDVDEIARWPQADPLGVHDRTGSGDLLVLLVRAELLRRFPGTVVLAAKSVGGLLPDEGTGEWETPVPVPLDAQTTLFLFRLSAAQARAERWLFVLREPLRGTRFGFDDGRPLPLDSWADLDWARVPLDDRGFVIPRTVGARPPRPEDTAGAAWGADAADVARIAFQRQFQVAFSAGMMLGAAPA
jgi:hypothetical protein